MAGDHVAESPFRVVVGPVHQREVLPRPLHRELPVEAPREPRGRDGGRAVPRVLDEEGALAGGDSRWFRVNDRRAAPTPCPLTSAR